MKGECVMDIKKFIIEENIKSERDLLDRNLWLREDFSKNRLIRSE